MTHSEEKLIALSNGCICCVLRQVRCFRCLCLSNALPGADCSMRLVHCDRCRTWQSAYASGMRCLVLCELAATHAACLRMRFVCPALKWVGPQLCTGPSERGSFHRKVGAIRLPPDRELRCIRPWTRSVPVRNRMREPRVRTQFPPSIDSRCVALRAVADTFTFEEEGRGFRCVLPAFCALATRCLGPTRGARAQSQDHLVPRLDRDGLRRDHAPQRVGQQEGRRRRPGTPSRSSWVGRSDARWAAACEPSRSGVGHSAQQDRPPLARRNRPSRSDLLSAHVWVAQRRRLGWELLRPVWFGVSRCECCLCVSLAQGRVSCWRDRFEVSLHSNRPG